MNPIEVAGSIAGALLAVVNLASLFVSNKTRADISDLKTWCVEQRAADDKAVREWCDKEFVRKDVLEARLDSLRAKAGS